MPPRQADPAMQWPNRRQRSLAVAIACLGGVLGLAACEPELTDRLPALSAEARNVTVSGLSSGAYMAGQYQFAHAETVSGAAIVAGGPYGCADSLVSATLPDGGAAFVNLTRASNTCMLDGLSLLGEPNPERLASAAARRAAAGEIDPIRAVRNDRVYLFSGRGDHTVVPGIVEATERFYRAVGVPEEKITFVRHDTAGHGFLTNGQGVDCGATGRPYINDCGVDQAGEILQTLLGPLQPPHKGPGEGGRLLAFDQRPFLDDDVTHGLAAQGLVFVPGSCRDAAGCRIHVAFHGCKQNLHAVGDAFARQAGYNRWAAANRVIVLYPQTTTTTFNANACWDWWGFTGSDFLTRKAPQIAAVNAMVRELASDTSTGQRAPQTIALTAE